MRKSVVSHCLLWLTVSAAAQAQDVQSSTSITFVPVSQASPSALSVLGIEAPEAVGGTGSSALPSRLELTKTLDGLNAAAEAVQEGRRGIKSLQEGHEDTMMVLNVIGQAIPVAGPVVSVAGHILTRQVNRAIAAETQRLERNFAKTSEDLVQAAVASASEETRQAWLARGVTDADAGAAMRDLVGPSQADFFNAYGMAGIPEAARDAFLDAKANTVMEALSRHAAMSEKDRADLRQNLIAQRKDIDDLLAFKEEVPRRLDDLQTLIETRTESLQAEVNSISRDVSTIQAQMWRNMDSRERLAALNDGFMPSLDPAEREELKESLTKTVGVLDTRDKVVSNLQLIGTVGNLLAANGLPIDAENLQRNVNIGTAAVNFLSNIALQNYMGALGSAAGLFGGGGSSPSDPAVHAKLDQILAISKEILAKVDALSEQLAESTEAILTKLERIDQNVEHILELQLSETIKAPLNKCRLFADEATQQFGMVDGHYPSYEARKRHFDSDNSATGQQYYRACRAFVDERRLVNPDGSTLGGAGVVDLFFAEKNVVRGDSNPVEPLYGKMLEAVFYSLDERDSPDCLDNTLALMADAPRKLSDISGLEVICSERHNEVRSRTLKSYNGQVIDGRAAYLTYLSPLSLRVMMGYADFLAPFDEFQTEEQGEAILRPLHAIQADGVSTKVNSDARKWSQSYVDHLNISTAQQVVLSGAYALPQARHAIAPGLTKGKIADGKPPMDTKELVEKLKELVENSWNVLVMISPDAVCDENDSRDVCAKERKPVWLKQDQLLADKMCPADLFPSFTDYAGWACLMAENPHFRSNLIRYTVSSSLNTSGTGLMQYQYALQSRDPAYIRRALPHLDIVWTGVTEESEFLWQLRIFDAANKHWVLPLPSAAEIRSDTLVYRDGADAIIELRDQAERRTILGSEKVTELMKDEAIAPILLDAFMTDKSISETELLQ